MHRLMAGTAVALALLCAGCGGSDRLSKQDFQAKADGICSKYSAKIKAAVANVGTDPAKIAQGVDKTISLIKQAQKEFKKLQPPKQYDAGWKEWTAINDREIATSRKLSDAARKKDDVAFKSAIAELESQGKDSDRVAKELGLNDCSNGA
jgi:hypothetical protein